MSAWAARQPLITIIDPPGDDFGAGTLVYPQRSDFHPGDLDLLQLKLTRDEEGFWFEATFKNTIRDPAGLPNSVGAESLENFARKGFYQFNIDVYVDTDREPDSGNTFTLPGRHVQIDPAYAWEKAVILTPRPELMRQQLLAALAEQYPARTHDETVASVDSSIFFPTQIRVRGKSIAFFVPATFFSGSDGTDWAITAFVTGALTTIPVDLSVFPSTKKPLERIQLGVMQTAPGKHADTFGYNGAVQGPVVDVLGTSTEQQVRQLGTNRGLTGISWGKHAIDDVLPMVAAASSPVTVPTPAASPRVAPIGELLQPENSANDKPATGQSIASRLQTLQQLYDQKLIDESEYKQQRQRILKEL
jgi:hypothetical protein